jgi:hypothetical protein
VLESVRQYIDGKRKRKLALFLLFSMEMVEENETVTREGESGRRREKEPGRSLGKISKVIYYNFCMIVYGSYVNSKNSGNVIKLYWI